MYCITHEIEGKIESKSMAGELCLWVSCPPPELPEDWNENLVEPSPEELQRMNLNAKELKWELPVRKFRFLGYGDRVPYPYELKCLGDGYLGMDQSKYYWYDSPVFTVGKIYKLEIFGDFSGDNGFMTEGVFIDDEGDEMFQELQFFEEVL